MTGEWAEEIDHENGDGMDNRWVNLRKVSHAVNMKNKRRYKNNTSGETGVYYHKHRKKWQAALRVDGKPVSLGYYDTREMAAAARAVAAEDHEFHRNHGKAR